MCLVAGAENIKLRRLKLGTNGTATDLNVDTERMLLDEADSLELKEKFNTGQIRESREATRMI